MTVKSSPRSQKSPNLVTLAAASERFKIEMLKLFLTGESDSGSWRQRDQMSCQIIAKMPNLYQCVEHLDTPKFL